MDFLIDGLIKPTLNRRADQADQRWDTIIDQKHRSWWTTKRKSVKSVYIFSLDETHHKKRHTLCDRIRLSDSLSELSNCPKCSKLLILSGLVQKLQKLKVT